MKPTKITTIPIQPATHVRSTQGDKWLFAVSEAYLEEYDTRKIESTGRKGGNLRRRRQLEKYNSYKDALRLWAAVNRFKMPLGYFAIWFFLPMPKSWRPKKQADMAGKPHQSTPDCDNLLKSFFDGIMPRKNKTRKEKGADDRRIHCYAAFKVWCPAVEARTLIVEYDHLPFLQSFQISDDHLPLVAKIDAIF